MNDETAECRGCHRKLEGSPYHQGGSAFVPVEGGRSRRALAHYFGGWVCSARCEIKVFEEMKEAGVWGTVERRLQGAAYDRHEANK